MINENWHEILISKTRITDAQYLPNDLNIQLFEFSNHENLFLISFFGISLNLPCGSSYPWLFELVNTTTISMNQVEVHSTRKVTCQRCICCKIFKVCLTIAK